MLSATISIKSASSKTPKNILCVFLTILFFNHVSADLEYRFPVDTFTQYRDLYIIPYVVLNESVDWKKEFLVFANY